MNNQDHRCPQCGSKMVQTGTEYQTAIYHCRSCGNTEYVQVTVNEKTEYLHKKSMLLGRVSKGIIDWEKVEDHTVSAIIELKVIPQAGVGFEGVASRIAKYPNVESVSLMSGSCDLTVVVKGRTLHEVSSFVAKELAVIDGVTSTATQFIMRRYKEMGVELITGDDDGRSKISL